MRRLTSAAGVTIVLVAVLLVWPVSAQTPGKWIKLAPFPEPGEELLGAAAGGKLYVFAGLAGAFIGNRLHLVSGDVQSAGIPNVELHTDSHDAFEVADH